MAGGGGVGSRRGLAVGFELRNLAKPAALNPWIQQPARLQRAHGEATGVCRCVARGALPRCHATALAIPTPENLLPVRSIAMVLSVFLAAATAVP